MKLFTNNKEPIKSPFYIIRQGWLRIISSMLLFGLSILPATSQKPAKEYVGAELYTKDNYLYGKFVMRMKVAKGSGVLSTFFTYKNDSWDSVKYWQEIDIEIFGRDTRTWQSNIITGYKPARMSVEEHICPMDLADEFHVYVVEWTPNYMAWFIDGVEYRRSSGKQVRSSSYPSSLRFNLWPSKDTSWVGPMNPSVLPQEMHIDYFEYHTYEPEDKNAPFTLSWRDNFDHLDTTVWVRANHTFGQNLSQFSPENVQFENGNAVLRLTKKEVE